MEAKEVDKKDMVVEGRPGLVRLASEADYVIQGTYTADTRDYEDHTFSGIMFDVLCKSDLPIQHLEITHVWVRGQLGKMQIFSCNGSFKEDNKKHLDEKRWTLVHQANHEPSPEELKEMKLSPPVKVQPGKTVGIYVHSLERGDQSIVYNNKHHEVTVEDHHFKLLPGRAHVSNIPFRESCPWGYAWREDREFVGRLQYAVKWKLWKPSNHVAFPRVFRNMVRTLQLCHRRKACILSKLPESILFYIINFCSWDWAGKPAELKESWTKDSQKNSAAYIKNARESDYQTALALQTAGLGILRERKYTSAAQRFSEGLSLLRGGVTGKRLRLSAELYSNIANCCLAIADGRDAQVSANVLVLPPHMREGKDNYVQILVWCWIE